MAQKYVTDSKYCKKIQVKVQLNKTVHKKEGNNMKKSSGGDF